METKLLHGRTTNQVVENWKMAHSLEELEDMLHKNSEAQCHHVRRKAIKLVDLLANYGTKMKQEFQQKLWSEMLEKSLRNECQTVLE